MSQNRTVRCRRSPSATSEPPASAALDEPGAAVARLERGAGGDGNSRAPQLPQKLFSAEFMPPQDRHTTGKAAPHWVQNRPVFGLSASQLRHFMTHRLLAAATDPPHLLP